MQMLEELLQANYSTSTMYVIVKINKENLDRVFLAFGLPEEMLAPMFGLPVKVTRDIPENVIALKSGDNVKVAKIGDDK